METTLVWYENPAFWASMAAIAAIVSAFFAGLTTKKTVREILDIVKADILIFVSESSDPKLWQPSPENINHLDVGELINLMSKRDKKYQKDKWAKVIRAAVEELKSEGFIDFR